MVTRDTKKQKILVVDDEPDNLDLLYRTFHREFKVLRSESGPSALEILEQEGDIAVIISDQRMPQMSGTEFLSLTAERYPDIIRIILTGYTDVEDLVDAINSGKVFKYVTKPWDDIHLKQVVHQAVDTHNILRARTEDLRRNLRRETLLNAVTATLRSALGYEELLSSISSAVGRTLESSYCILRPYVQGEFSAESVVYRSSVIDSDTDLNPYSVLGGISETVWSVTEIKAFDIGILDGQEVNPVAVEACRSIGIASTLMVPLVCQHELVAVLALHQVGENRVWQADEIELLGMVADQAALALAQAQSYEQVRSLAKREALINTITTAIRSSLEPQEIFASITSQLGQALMVDGCTLSLWRSEDQYVQCVGLYDAELPPSASLEELAAALPKSNVLICENPVLVKLQETQAPVSLPDLSLHPEMNVPEMRSLSKALLVLPLLSEGKIIGSISLRQNTSVRHWTQSEIRLVESVAEQAAIAVQQANLFQTTRQQAEKLIELDRAKTEFFQNISHEFRTPLTLMLGPLETAVSQKVGLSVDQSSIALRSSRRLLRLVNQLLDLQRLDAGEMRCRFQSCDLADFVNQIVETFGAYCEKKGIQLISALQPCESVYLDLEKFDKVVYNLLSNAMKFTPSGGTITVSLQPSADRSEERRVGKEC